MCFFKPLNGGCVTSVSKSLNSFRRLIKSKAYLLYWVMAFLSGISFFMGDKGTALFNLISKMLQLGEATVMA